MSFEAPNQALLHIKREWLVSQRGHDQIQVMLSSVTVNMPSSIRSRVREVEDRKERSRSRKGSVRSSFRRLYRPPRKPAPSP